MACELCGADEPLEVVRDIYDRRAFRICAECRKINARERPSAPDPRDPKSRVGGDDTRRWRLPPEIECPHCRGTGGETCPECEGAGGETERRPCSLCEGSGRYDCFDCGGDGRKLLRKCRTCGGSGQVECEKCGGDGIETVRHLCPHCGGSGHLCERCDGRGIIRLYS